MPRSSPLLSRHAAAGVIERLVERQGDVFIEMMLPAPDGAVVKEKIALADDCASILHWRHPDCPDEKAKKGGAVELRAVEAFAYLEAVGLGLPQGAPVAGWGERLVPTGTFVGMALS